MQLSAEFVDRIRYQNQGVILVEFRAPTQQPLTLTIQTGTGIFVITLPRQTTLGELSDRVELTTIIKLPMKPGPGM